MPKPSVTELRERYGDGFMELIQLVKRHGRVTRAGILDYLDLLAA